MRGVDFRVAGTGVSESPARRISTGGAKLTEQSRTGDRTGAVGRPLLITGMERSGTSLLGAMMAAHSRVSGSAPSFVPNLFHAWADGVARPDQLDRFLDSLYGRTRFKGAPVRRETLRDRLAPRLPLSFRELATVVATACADDPSPAAWAYWIDRTPLFVTTLSRHPRRFDQVMGDYRLLVIVRDGRAVLSSVLQAHAVLHTSFYTDVFYLAAQWRRAAALAARHAASGRCLEVRYEALVARPAATLQRVCRFLELSYEPAMLDYHRTSSGSPIHQLLSEGPRPDRVDAWRTEVDPGVLRVFDLLAGSALRRAGYPPLPAELRHGRLTALGATAGYWLKTRGPRYLQAIRGRGAAAAP